MTSLTLQGCSWLGISQDWNSAQHYAGPERATQQGYYQSAQNGYPDPATYSARPHSPYPQGFKQPPFKGPADNSYTGRSYPHQQSHQTRWNPNPTPSAPYRQTGTSALSSMHGAYGSSRLIEAKRLEKLEAEEEYTQARADSLPELDLGASIGYANRRSKSAIGSINDVSSSRGTGSLRVSISQPLYTGGRLTSQKRRAEAGIRAAEEDLRNTASDVLVETLTAHMETIRDQNLLSLYERSVQNLESQKATTDLLFQYGEASVADVALIDARLKSAYVDASEASLKLEESRTNYHFLTGKRSDNLALPSLAGLPASLEEAVNIAMQRNPEILKARLEGDIAQNDLKIAKSRRLPSLSLDGTVSESLGQTDLIDSSSAATVAMNLRIPFSLGGKQKSEIKQATHTVSRRKLNEQQVMMDMRRKITLAWNSLHSANYAIELRGQEIHASETAYRSMLEQFQSGIATQSELLMAESELLRAHIEFENAKFEKQILQARLLSLLGGLDLPGSRQVKLVGFDTRAPGPKWTQR